MRFRQQTRRTTIGPLAFASVAEAVRVALPLHIHQVACYFLYLGARAIPAAFRRAGRRYPS
jgi:hypothetical protein